MVDRKINKQFPYDLLPCFIYLRENERIVEVNEAFKKAFNIPTPLDEQSHEFTIRKYYRYKEHKNLFHQEIEKRGNRISNYYIHALDHRNKAMVVLVDCALDADSQNYVGVGRVVAEEAMLHGFFQTNDAWEITFCSDSFAKNLGYESAKEVIGQVKFCDLLQVKPSECPPQRAIWNERTVLMDKKGNDIIFLLSLHKIKCPLSGKTVGYEGNIEPQWKLGFFDQSTNPAYILQENGDKGRYEFTYANQAFIEMFGYESLEDIIGRDMMELVSKHHHNMVLNNVRDKFAGEDVGSYKFHGVRSDGTQFDVEVFSAYLHFKGDGALLGSARDVTIEEARRTRQETIAMMVAGINHLLGNSNGAIMGSADILRKILEEFPDSEVAKDKDVQKAVRSIIDNTKISADIMTRMKAYANWKKREIKFYSINEVIEDTLRMMGPTMGEVQIDEHLDADLPEVKMDHVSIALALFNILHNAKVHLKVAEPRVEIWSEVSDNQLRLVVSDNGPGISEVNREKVFLPFWTTNDADNSGLSGDNKIDNGHEHTSNRRNGIGTNLGVGLPLAKVFVREGGGRLSYEPMENRGATFVLTFPIVRE